MSSKIAFVTYETPFAPCGGIAAMIRHLPDQLQKSSGVDTTVITPFHHNIEKTISIEPHLKHKAQIHVPFGREEVAIDILTYNDDKYQCTWCFLKTSDTRFFGGRQHPYDVEDTQKETANNLLRDSLIFGASIPRVIFALDNRVEWILLMQDWEAATAALAMAGETKRHKLYLTLHNCYDHSVQDEDLTRVRINAALCPGFTVLQRTLSVIEKPVFTVSSQYAIDLAEDVFQSQVMAPHLKEMLRSRLIGINNGLFVSLSLKDEIISHLMNGHFDPIQKWKDTRKKEALKVFGDFMLSEERSIWGNLKEFQYHNFPWFVMAGRDDSRQKGYDIAAYAATEFLEEGGEAQFIFFPIPGDEGLKGLAFLKSLSEKFPKNVLVFPFMFRDGFFAALQGAAYGIIPSLYEPFGMANEFYLNGTVGIGRATGGIIQQIVPLRSVSSFSEAVRKRTDKWHNISAPPTGILFREKDEIKSVVDDWMGMNATSYLSDNTGYDRVEERRKYSLFVSMSHELKLSITDGIKIYINHPEIYFKMVREGMNYIKRIFSWEKTAQQYIQNIM